MEDWVGLVLQGRNWTTQMLSKGKTESHEKKLKKSG